MDDTNKPNPEEVPSVGSTAPVEVEPDTIPSQEGASVSSDYEQQQAPPSLDTNSQEQAPVQIPVAQPSVSTSPIQQPIAPVQPQPITPVPTATSYQAVGPKKSKKKGLIIGGIVAAALLVLGGGGIATYALWYQNSDKIIVDAVSHAIAAETVALKGSIKVVSTSPNSKLDVTLDVDTSARAIESDTTAALTVKYDDRTIKLTGAATTVKDGTVYVKVSGVKDAINDVLGEYASYYMTDATTKVVNKIDDQWIKIAASDLKDIDEDYAKIQSCTTEVFEKVADDTSYKNEVVDLYKKNKFLEVGDTRETEKIDGVTSYKFTITGDKDAAKSFSKGLSDTKLYKELKECDDDFAIDDDWADSSSSDTDNNTKTTVTLWVSKWSHEITKVEITGDSDNTKVSISAQPTFNGSVEVSAPSSSISLSELQSDIEDIVNSYSSTSGSSYSADSSYDYSYDL